MKTIKQSIKCRHIFPKAISFFSGKSAETAGATSGSRNHTLQGSFHYAVSINPINIRIMKKLLLGAVALFLGIAVNAQMQFVREDSIDISSATGGEYFIVEVLEPSADAIASDPALAGTRTYRFFMDMQEGYGALGFAASTSLAEPFHISSTMPFYNNAGQTYQTVNVAFWGMMPHLEYDSYASDGSVGDATMVGCLQRLDTDDTNPLGYVAGNDLSAPNSALQIPGDITVFINGTDVVSESPAADGWVPGQTSGPTADNVVFLGQATTAGDLTVHCVLDIVNKTALTSSLFVLDYESNPPQPEPPVVDLLEGLVNQLDISNTTWQLAWYAVGQWQGSNEWWNPGDLAAGRPCHADDQVVLNSDGSFQNIFGADTWVEAWQDGLGDGCRAAVAPHNGSNAATWAFDGTNLTVNGVGAHLGLAKVINGAEIANPADAAASITYITSFNADYSVMYNDINVGANGEGWWQYHYNLVSGTPGISSLPATTVDKNTVITLSAVASDPVDGGTVTQVEFFANGQSVGVATSAPFEVVYTAISNVTISAVATDDAGLTSTAAEFDLTVTDPNPTVIENMAAAGGNLSATTFTADVYDNDQPISSVTFSIDGQDIPGTLISGVTYEASYDPATAGVHDLTILALNSDSEPTSVVVPGLEFVNDLPVISDITPVLDGFNLEVSTDTVVVVTVSDADGTIASVTVAGVAATDNGDGTWSATVSAPAGQGSFEANVVATDDQGGIAQVEGNIFASLPEGNGYLIQSVEELCTEGEIFLLPIILQSPSVSDVIGYDLELLYDASLVTPTRNVIAAEPFIADRDYTSFSLNVVGDSAVYVSLYLNAAGATADASFGGVSGDTVMYIEFGRNWEGAGSAEFTIDIISESFAGAPVVDYESDKSGTYATIEETIFNGVINHISSGLPLAVDAGVQSIVSGGTESTTVDAAGNFVWDVILGGYTLNISRDVDNSISVMNVINGYDAYLASLVAVNDVAYRPSVEAIIAMDVDRNGRISAGDASMISERAVLLRGEFEMYDAVGDASVPTPDWIFIPQNILMSDEAYRISSTYPLDDGDDSDGRGYSRKNVPVPSLDLAISALEYTEGCPDIEDEEYKALLVGDADQSYVADAAGASPVALKAAASNKVVLDLNRAIVSGDIVEIPVMIESTKTVNSVDFDIEINNAIEFISVVDLAGLNTTANNIDARVLTSAYTNNTIGSDAPALAIRVRGFDMNDADFNFNMALINGRITDTEIIGSLQNATSTAITSVSEAQIYPNPSNDLINVRFVGTADVALISMSGQVVEIINNVDGSTTFDVSELAAGVYTLMVGTDAYFVSVIK
jgi:hypothetical protein